MLAAENSSLSATWRFLPACQSQAKDVSTLSSAAAAARPSAHFDPAWHSFQTHTHDCARHTASRPIWVNSRFHLGFSSIEKAQARNLLWAPNQYRSRLLCALYSAFRVLPSCSSSRLTFSSLCGSEYLPSLRRQILHLNEITSLAKITIRSASVFAS